MEHFSLHTNQDGRCELILRGELDIEAAERIRRAMERFADAREVRVDASDVTFVDSIGIRSLLHIAEWCERSGARCSFVFSTPVSRVLRVLGIEGRFPHGNAAA
jgi:anti-sigma B factor antagonist/stage II sporulation protein AA (anti-sigma F factor antagonist)